jgi:hypothetical protein
VKIVAGDKRARPSIGLVGKDQVATPDVLLQSGIVAVALLPTFRLAFAEDPQGELPPGCIDAGDCLINWMGVPAIEPSDDPLLPLTLQRSEPMDRIECSFIDHFGGSGPD